MNLTPRVSDRVRALRRGLVLGLGAALTLATSACTSRLEGLDKTKLPEEVQEDYALFAHRCSKCHSLARPLNAGITDDNQWVMYVNRMRRQPGSGISPDDQERILRFLRYYAGELRRKEAERKAPPPPSSSVPPAASSSPSASPPPPPPSPPAASPPAPSSSVDAPAKGAP